MNHLSTSTADVSKPGLLVLFSHVPEGCIPIGLVLSEAKMCSRALFCYMCNNMRLLFSSVRAVEVPLGQNFVCLGVFNLPWLSTAQVLPRSALSNQMHYVVLL
jgi:hypothetical protein